MFHSSLTFSQASRLSSILKFAKKSISILVFTLLNSSNLSLFWLTSLKTNLPYLLHSVQKVETSFYRQPLQRTSPLYLFLNPLFWQNFLNNITPTKYQINTEINSWDKVISSFLETTLYSFFYKQHFLIQNNNNFKYQKKSKEKKTLKIKDLLSKEHYCFKIYTLLTKSIA